MKALLRRLVSKFFDEPNSRMVCKALVIEMIDWERMNDIEVNLLGV